jgi:hypothetical protein
MEQHRVLLELDMSTESPEAVVAQRGALSGHVQSQETSLHCDASVFPRSAARKAARLSLELLISSP